MNKKLLKNSIKYILSIYLFTFSCSFAAVECNGDVVSVYCTKDLTATANFPEPTGQQTIFGCGCYNPKGEGCISYTMEKLGNPEQGQCCEQVPNGFDCMNYAVNCFSSGCANWCAENECTNKKPKMGPPLT